MKGVRLVIKGRVQGVGYRYFVLKEAEKLGVVGYVRNMNDGNVEVVYIPDENENTFVEKLKRGPFLARVEDIESSYISLPNGIKGFEIRY